MTLQMGNLRGIQKCYSTTKFLKTRLVLSLIALSLLPYKKPHTIAHAYKTSLLQQINGTLDCIQGTMLSLKLDLSLKKCHNISDFDTLHAWNSKVKGSDFIAFLNSNQDCHTFEEIKEWIFHEYSADICILQNISWLDPDLNVVNTNIDIDLASVLGGNQVV